MTKTDKIFHTLVVILATLGLIVAIYNKVTWDDSIHNPENAEYVQEVAFNLDKPAHLVTQKEFRQRYCK